MRRRNTAASSLLEPLFMSRHRFQKQTCHLGLNDGAAVVLHSAVRPVGRPTNLVMPVEETLHNGPLNKKQRFSFSRKKYLNSLHDNKNQTTYLNMNIYLHKGFVLFMLSLRFCASARRFYSDTKDFHCCSHSRFILFSHILRESISNRY